MFLDILAVRTKSKTGMPFPLRSKADFTVACIVFLLNSFLFLRSPEHRTTRKHLLPAFILFDREPEPVAENHEPSKEVLEFYTTSYGVQR